MKTSSSRRLALCALGGWIAAQLVPSALAAEFNFTHHFISRTLPVGNDGVGDYGLSALVDLDRDGDLDFVFGGRQTNPRKLYWFEYQGPDKWLEHLVGTD